MDAEKKTQSEIAAHILLEEFLSLYKYVWHMSHCTESQVKDLNCILQSVQRIKSYYLPNLVRACLRDCSLSSEESQILYKESEGTNQTQN